MSHPETPIMNRIMLAATKAGHRLWRNTVAKGWTGKMQRIDRAGNYYLPAGTVVIYGAVPLHAGIGVGSPDLIGLTMRDGAPIFTGVEVKTENGITTTEQNDWIEALRRLGCVAGVARSDEDYHRIIGVNK